MKAKQKFWLEPSADCRNCGTHMPEGANYCPKCAKRNTTGKIKLWEFLKEAFSNLFNIDTKFFRTLFSFIFPGKLTNEFFKGRHQSFASPLRMFFVTMLLFIAALSWTAQEYIAESDFLGIENARTRMQFRDSITLVKEQIDVSRMSKERQLGMDSLYNKLMEEIDLDVKGDVPITFNINDKVVFKKEDVLKLTPDELIEKYEIESFFAQAAIKQVLKLNKDPESLMASIFGNLTLMFLILIPCIAFVFKLLYIRKDRYYVEHLVFLFHYHSFVLFVGMIALLAGKWLEPEVVVWICLFLGLYLLFSMKKVYEQSWMKTILKSFVIFVSYLLVFTICLLIITTISFFLF